jgi:cyanophycinase
VVPLVDQIRLLVSDGLPYLGYSAGAMIAADRALVGGWRVGGVEVCREDASEGLDEVELREGLGLVDLTIDVHAVQAGTISRLIASAEAEFVTAGLAIDEDTVLVVGEGALVVRGSGSVWRVVSGEDSVSVATMGA